MSQLSDTEQTAMLTPTEVLEYNFCPRFTWFMHIQQIPQYEETRFKVQKGRAVHLRRSTSNRDYLRKKIGAVRREVEVYMASRKLAIRGIVDELLWLDDGSIVPLDYKYTEGHQDPYKTHFMQLLLYAMLIEETYDIKVHRGFLAYVRNGNRLIEVNFDDNDKSLAKKQISDIFEIIQTERIPAKSKSRLRCDDCCYRNICV